MRCVFIYHMVQDRRPQEQQEVTKVTRGAGDPGEFAEGETKELRGRSLMDELEKSVVGRVVR